MAERWKVIHRFSSGVLVQNPIPSYQNPLVSLHYEGDKLLSIEHEVECEDSSEANQAIAISQKDLELFVELLRYRRGVSLPDISSSAKRVESQNGSPSKSTGFKVVALDALLCSSIVMPDQRVFSHCPARLLVWLRLTNDALDSRDPAYAIRNYYMIWEDLHQCRNYKDWPADANEIRLTRHFVSHGGELWPQVRKFIKRKLGRQIDRYDPSDSEQVRFVRLQCESARNLIGNLIEAELAKLL